MTLSVSTTRMGRMRAEIDIKRTFNIRHWMNIARQSHVYRSTLRVKRRLATGRSRDYNAN